MNPQRLMFIAFLARWFTTGDDADFELVVPFFDRSVPWPNLCITIMQALHDSGRSGDGRDRDGAEKLCRHLWRAFIFKEQRANHLRKAKHHIIQEETP